jgi:phage tail-like protein
VRGLLDGLVSPHPIGATLPGLYEDDDVAQRFCQGLDEVLAPVMVTLDNLDAYLDPRTAPEDLLPWLATWVGLAFDDAQTSERQRALVRAGAELHRWRGTVTGITGAVRVLFDVTPDVVEPGGVSASLDPHAPFPGDADGELLVVVHLEDTGEDDLDRLDAVVAAVKPAHVPHRVEVRGPWRG